MNHHRNNDLTISIRNKAEDCRDIARQEGGIPHDVAIVTPRVTAHIIAEPGDDASLLVERLLTSVAVGRFELRLDATEYRGS